MRRHLKTRARRLFSPFLICIAAVSFGRDLPAQTQTDAGHVPWVQETLKRIETIKPGMTRAELLQVFTTEGGLSTGLQRTYASRACPYFKVDVEFRAVGRPDHDREGRVTLLEDPRDIVVKISRPYLAWSVLD